MNIKIYKLQHPSINYSDSRSEPKHLLWSRVNGSKALTALYVQVPVREQVASKELSPVTFELLNQGMLHFNCMSCSIIRSQSYRQTRTVRSMAGLLDTVFAGANYTARTFINDSELLFCTRVSSEA